MSLVEINQKEMADKQSVKFVRKNIIKKFGIPKTGIAILQVLKKENYKEGIDTSLKYLRSTS